MAQQVLIIRGGGFQGGVVYQQVSSQYSNWTTYVWDDGANVHKSLQSFPRLPSDAQFSPDVPVHIYVAVGSGVVRERLVEEAKKKIPHCTFPTSIHATATVAASAHIGQGCFVGPHAVIHCYARVEDFCLINSTALVEHDCVVQEYASINPGAILLGNVRVGRTSTIGSNACVREGSVIEDGVMVAMQSGVVSKKPLHKGPTKTWFWAGVPARLKDGAEKKVKKNPDWIWVAAVSATVGAIVGALIATKITKQ